MIPASGSSPCPSQAEASRQNDVVSYGTQQDSRFIRSSHSSSSRFMYAAFLLLGLYMLFYDLGPWTPLAVQIVLQTCFRFMFGERENGDVTEFVPRTCPALVLQHGL